jgi:hypothetical protein
MNSVNKAQIEGVAKVFDNVATSALIGAAVGLTGHGTITLAESLALIAAASLFLFFGFLLRIDL